MKLNKKQSTVLTLIAAGLIGGATVRTARANDEAAPAAGAADKDHHEDHKGKGKKHKDGESCKGKKHHKDGESCKGKDGCDKGGSCKTE